MDEQYQCTICQKMYDIDWNPNDYPEPIEDEELVCDGCFKKMDLTMVESFRKVG